MLELLLQEDHLKLHIKWREAPIKIKAYIYVCEKLCKTLNEELEARNIESTLPQTIIPETITFSIHQIVQGILHYAIYASKQSRVKNKGLLLATMITGINQLSELIQTLTNYFQYSHQYYLVGVEYKPVNLHKCNTLKSGDLLKKIPLMSSLVKNVYIVLSLF